MHQINRLNFTNELLAEFPEYKNSEHYKLADADNYSVAAGFGFYLRDFLIQDSEPLSLPLVKRAFEWINKVFNGESADKEVLNVLGVEIFETLAGSEGGIKLAREALKGLALESFEETMRWFKK